MRELTPEETCALTAGAAMWSTVAVPEAGVPGFTMADGPLGIASGRVDERDVSLLSPCPTALGASWDRDLARRVGEMVGHEAVARGVDAVLAPNLNLARSPLAGRAFEYFSEDPLLAGVLGAAWIEGLQATGTGSIAKHLVCNDSETKRDSVNVLVDERTLREVYLLPFELAARAGCAGMLAAYNKVDGRWCSEQGAVISDIVKREWGFGGVVMSDWFGTHDGVSAITAGLDLEMPGPARVMGRKLVGPLADGAVALERVRDAAARVARCAVRVTQAKAEPRAPNVAQALLVEAAAAGMVLLRNEGAMLPLDPSTLGKLAVIGPNAVAPCFQGGTFARIALAPETPSPLDAIRAAFGTCEVVFEPGVDPQPRLPSMPVTPASDLGDGMTRGMTVDYFAAEDFAGEPVFTETRDTNSLVWFVGVHEQGRFDAPGAVRASGHYRAERSGLHRFHVGATGDARLLVDGHEVARTHGPIEPGDVMGVLKRGDAMVGAVELAEGEDVLVTVEFRYRAARVQGLWYGVRGPGSAAEMLARAVSAAGEADAVVLMVGETADASVESKDREDTLLPSAQRELIAAVCAANPRTAVVVNVGHAYDAGWEGAAAAQLAVWYPGEGFARALADVLTGAREPAGRLPVTLAADEADYPGLNVTPGADDALAYAEGTLVGYRGLVAAGKPARHAFGSGLGYARFAWADAAVEAGAVAVTVTNVSARAGAEVVQVYRDAPECALVGFAQLVLAPGESRRVSVPLERRSLEVWDGGWRPAGETLTLRVARHAEDPGLRVTIPFADVR